MGRNLDDIMNALPAERQAKIRARTAQLKSEYETLQELRKALNITQEQLAADLGLKQANISRLEKRHDMLLSTLSRAIRALGGKLDLTVTFEDRPPVSITKITEQDKFVQLKSPVRISRARRYAPPKAHSPRRAVRTA
jgi:transcriptional regulator with XRE-family HTH domain